MLSKYHLNSRLIDGAPPLPPTTLHTDLRTATIATVYDEPKANRQHDILDLLGDDLT
jgi:hypothetical protein